MRDATNRLLEVLAQYRRARKALLLSLNCEVSNRDPLAEFSERFVAAWLGGELASSRVQPGWDLRDLMGRSVEVRYLANPSEQWVNEHHVRFVEGLDRYALVVFEDFELHAALCFDRAALGDVCRRLAKRHPDQDRCLQLTRANLRQLVTDRQAFADLGVEVFTPPPRSSG